jgi:rhodanese-related sulfurtransferase
MAQQDVGHIDSAGLYGLLQAQADVQVVDVREPSEHAQGVIEGATLLPMGQVRSRWQELDGSRPIHVICHMGGRSAMAASFLAQQGLRAVNVDDGMDGWQRHGYPTVRG